jgi:MEMO1 family protein
MRNILIILIIVILIVILYLYLGGKKMEAKESVAKKDVFVSKLGEYGWYPEDPVKLKLQLDGYLVEANKAEQKVFSNVCAVVMPHAGIGYSGQTAAYALRQIQGKSYSRVIIIGPSHQVQMPDCVSLPSATHYKTPFGEVSLDTEFMAALSKSSYFKKIEQAHLTEHSVQIEIPFLQMAIKDLKIVPIVVGQLSSEARKNISRELLSVIDSETLVVVSGDFIHYGPRFQYTPFRENIPENIKKLDFSAFQYIKNVDSDGFINFCQSTRATICGREPIALLLDMISPDTEVEKLNYASSGDLTGDWSNPVSYMSIVFSGKWRDKNMENVEDKTLTIKDKKDLIQLAKDTINYCMKNKTEPSAEQLGYVPSKATKEIMGVFVTLKKHGQLRGCIGEIMPQRSLYKAVVAQAINAAFNDSRFPQVEPKEVADLEFEISALTVPRPIDYYNEIVLGKHGIILQKEGRSSVFLPQVALEQGWDLETTLTHLSTKAGLSATAWQKGTQFFVFEAIVWD